MGKPRVTLDSTSPCSSAKGRNRAGDLGRAYDTLRDILPTYQSGRKKLTKIETLKLASLYIGDLAGLLEDVRHDPSAAYSPDIRLVSRTRRNSTSSSEMSRSDSFYSLTSSSPSNDYLYSPFAEYNATERLGHPVCSASQALRNADERGAYCRYVEERDAYQQHQHNSVQFASSAQNWPSDPWAVQTHPAAFRPDLNDSYSSVGHDRPLGYTKAFRQCQWSHRHAYANYQFPPEVPVRWHSAC